MSIPHSEEFDGLCLLHASGELSGADAARFDAHRKGCPECSELLEAIGEASRAADAAAYSLPEPRLEAIAAEVLRRPCAPEAAEGRWKLFPVLQRIWGACAVAAALMVGIYISDLPRTPRMELSWKTDLGSELDSLDEDLNSLSQAIELSDNSGYELDAELNDLEETAQLMEGELL